MAIVQASLSEDILSRQEKAVLRGIYRAQQLAEALVALKKTTATLLDAASGKPTTSISVDESRIKAYLTTAIIRALASTKVPASTVNEEKSSSPVAA